MEQSSWVQAVALEEAGGRGRFNDLKVDELTEAHFEKHLKQRAE